MCSFPSDVGSDIQDIASRPGARGSLEAVKPLQVQSSPVQSSPVQSGLISVIRPPHGTARPRHSSGIARGGQLAGQAETENVPREESPPSQPFSRCRPGCVVAVSLCLCVWMRSDVLCAVRVSVGRGGCHSHPDRHPHARRSSVGISQHRHRTGAGSRLRCHTVCTVPYGTVRYVAVS